MGRGRRLLLVRRRRDLQAEVPQFLIKMRLFLPGKFCVLRVLRGLRKVCNGSPVVVFEAFVHDEHFVEPLDHVAGLLVRSWIVQPLGQFLEELNGELLRDFQLLVLRVNGHYRVLLLLLLLLLVALLVVVVMVPEIAWRTK